MSLTWNDTRAIGEALYEAFPDLDPLGLSFVKLHQLIVGLDGFDSDPKASTEKLLEAIQMVWYGEWKMDHA